MKKEISMKIKQSGAALITALFLLVVLTMLALSSMNTNIMDERMAGNSQEKQRAFRAAEIGVELAYDDEDAFSTVNTSDSDDDSADDPYNKSSNDLGDYDADVSYNSVYIQKTKPPRGSGWDSTMSFYHFGLSATSTTTSGISTTMVQGAYQVGRDDGA